MKLLFAFCLFMLALQAFAQSPKVQGQNATSGVYSPNILVPNKNATKINGTTSLIQNCGSEKNRLENCGFEHTTYTSGWSTSVTSTATITPSVNTATPLEGKKSASYACAGGASGGVCTIFQDVATSHRFQGMASLQVLSDTATGVKVCSRVDAANSLCKDIVSTNPGNVPVPVILGATSTGVAAQITVAASQTINVTLDEGMVGAQDVKQDIDQSRLFGTLKYASSANCIWNHTSTTLLSFAADTDCAAPTVTGSITAPATKIPAFVIPAGSPKGNYFVVAQLTAYGGTNSTVSTLRLSDGTNSTEPSNSYTSAGVGAFSGLTGLYENLDTTQKTITIQGASSGGTITLDASASSVYRVLQFHVYYFPPGQGSIYSSTNADTDWSACTLGATQGFTLTSQAFRCKRQGGDLVVGGSAVIATVAAAEMRIGLPTWNGVALTTKGSSILPSIQVVGDGGRNNASGPGTKNWTILASASSAYLTVGLNHYDVASAPLTSQNGDSVLIAGNTFFLNNVRIPIEGWENSNVIIGSFNEVVTTPGVTRPALCSADFAVGSAITAHDGGCFASGSGTMPRTITFTSSYWASKPKCWCDATYGSSVGSSCVTDSETTSTVLVRAYNNNALLDTAIQVFCHGSKNP